MLNLKKIAVTGSIAAGKSTVCSLFRECGAFVISADQIVHQLLSEPIVSTNNSLSIAPQIIFSVRQKVVDLLGAEILYDDKEQNLRINREIVANIVFENKEKLEALTNILHPEIMKIIKDKYAMCKKAHTHTLFVAEIPVLFEMYEQNPELKKCYEPWFDATICVVCDEEVAKARFLKESIDKNQALTSFKKRSHMQLSAEEKKKRSDYILTNQGEKELKQQVFTLYNTLIKIP